MEVTKLVIFGAADMARIAAFYFSTDSDYEIVAFTADREFCHSEEYLGKPLVPFDELEGMFPPSEVNVFVAISYARMNSIRESKCAAVKEKGYALASYVSSRCSYISQYPPGENCFILENNTIQPYVRIGNNVWLWSGNHIGHDSVIKDNVYVSSHVVISGFCTIGENSFLGVNSTLRDGLVIGREVLVGAGAAVMQGLGDRAVIIPAKSVVIEKTSEQVKI